jgi:hypothetical protein
MAFLKQYGLLHRWTTAMKETGSIEDFVAVNVFEEIITRHGRKRHWRDYVRGFNAGFEAGRENPPRYSELASVDDQAVDWETSFESISLRDGDPIPPLAKKRVAAHKKISKRQLDAIEAMRLLRQDGKTPPRKLRPKPARVQYE